MFKVYVKDSRRIEQVQSMMDQFEVGGKKKKIGNDSIDLEWEGFDVKRDRMGDYIEARY